MFNKKTLLSMLAVSSLVIAACGTNGDDVGTDVIPPAEEQEETTTDDTADDTSVDEAIEPIDDYENVTITPEEAFDIYMDKYPNAKVTEVELEKDMGEFVYEVEGYEGTTEYELKIDPADGNITKESIDTDNDIDETEITRDHVAKVINLVNQAFSEVEDDATLKEWKIESDDGIVKLEVELNINGLGDQERTYNVDTGELIELDD